MTVQRSQMRELLISTGRKIAGGCDAAIAGVNASTARRLGVAAMIGVAASLAGCSKNENPLPQSRAGSGSYDSNSYRLPVDPATHLVLLEVSRDAQASVVNFAGGSGQGVGDGSTVSGAQSNQSRKFVIGGVIRSTQRSAILQRRKRSPQ